MTYTPEKKTAADLREYYIFLISKRTRFPMWQIRRETQGMSTHEVRISEAVGRKE
jgi:hypothetical protein